MTFLSGFDDKSFKNADSYTTIDWDHFNPGALT